MEEDDLTYDDTLDAGYGDEENQNESTDAEDEGGEDDSEEQSDPESDEDGSDEDESPEENASKLQQVKMQAEEKFLKAYLTILSAKISMTSQVALSDNERKNMEKAKKHKGLKDLVGIINAKLLANGMKKTMQTGTKLVPVAKYLLIALACVVAIAVIVRFLAEVFGTGGGHPSVMFGVTGKDFYGIRMVYRNDEQAKNEMIDDYLSIVNDAVDGVDKTKYVVNVELPSEDYKINYQTFSQDYPALGSLVLDIAKTINDVDNQTSTASDLETVLTEIKYFGVPQECVNDVAKTVEDFIKSKTTDTEGNSVGAEFKPSFKEVVEKYTTRTKKLFIKDYIFKSDEQMQENVVKENYEAFIFMPKKSVTMKSMSFIIQGENVAAASLNLKHDGSEISLVKDENNYGDEENNIQRFIYSCNPNTSVSTYQNIDTNKRDALTEGVTLFDITTIDGINKDVYLSPIENNENVLTYKDSGVVLTISFNGEQTDVKPFTITEFATDWE